MLEIGRYNTLAIGAFDDRGAWLATDDEPVLLPKREVPREAGIGTALEVFVYRTPYGLTATLRRPGAQVGEFALLQVVEIGPHGAYLDWGLDKQLLVPFREQPEPMQVGRRYLVRVRLDREGRVIGSGRIDKFLEPKATGLKAGDAATLLLWQFTDLGAKVIVNHRFSGLLYREELTPAMRPGDLHPGFVRTLREDGKLDVSLRKVGTAAAKDARQVILAALEADPFLPLHDHSPPELVQEQLGLSKKQFKKAVGNLYKEGRVAIEENGIRLQAGKPPARPPQPSPDKRSRRRQKRNGPRSGGGR